MPGPELEIAVGEFRLQLQRAGGGIDLVVDALQRAGVDDGDPVIAEHIDQQCALAGGGVDSHDLLLRQAELHRDRLQLGNDNKTGYVGRVNDVALVDLAQAGAAGQWRNDLGVAKHRLHVVDRGLIGFYKGFRLRHHGLLRIGLLLGAGVGCGELLIAREVEPLVGQLRLILRLLGDRLIVLRLIDHGIDFAEHVAFLDVLAFDEVDRDQLAVDLGAHDHIVQRAHRADAIEIDRHVLHPRRRRQHRDGKIARQVGAVAALLGLIRQPADVTEAAEDQERDRDRHHSPQHAADDALACGLCGLVQFRLKEHRPAFPSWAPSRPPAPDRG